MRCSLRFPLLLLAALVLALPAGAQSSADLQLEKLDSPDPVLPGDSITYEILLTNAGPDAAEFVSLEDTLPAEVTFLSLFADPSWTCSTPAVGSGGTVSCSIDALPVGISDFFITVMVGAGVTPGTVITNTATASAETPDPDEGGPSASTDTTVAAPPPTSDVSVTKVDDPDPVMPGANLVYTITVTNTGTIDATSVNLVDPLPPETTFVSLSPLPAGWMCTTPAVGTNGDVLCSISTFPPGSAVFTLTVAVNSDVTPGTQIANTATVSATDDLDEGNNNGSASTTVAGNADLSVTKVDDPDPVTAGTNLTYTITVTSAGPNFAAVSLSDPLPAGTTFVSLSSPAGWSCATPPVGSGGTVSCSIGSFGVESAVFTLTVAVGPGTPAGTLLNTATASSAASDPNPGDNSGSASTTVVAPTRISGTKTAAGTFVPGSAVTYTVVLTNSGSIPQADNPGNELTDVLPATLTLVSASATSGTATATVATNTVTWNGGLAGGGSVTITINATINSGVSPGTTISNQGAIAYDADSNGTNEAAAVTDDPATQPSGDPTSFQVVAEPPPPAAIPALDGLGLAVLAALLSFAGAWVLRRRRA